MKIRKYIAALSLSLIIPSAYSQNGLTFKNALNMAMKDNPQYAVKKLEAESAALKVRKQITDHLPDVYVTGGIQYNFQIPSTPIPMKFIDPGSDSDEIYPAKFATKHNANWGINFSYDLFNPEKINSVRSERKLAEISRLDKEIQRIILTNTVRLDYAANLIAKRQIEYCKSDSIHAQSALEYTRNRNREGIASDEDLILSEENYNDMQIRSLGAYADLFKSRQRLLADLGIDPLSQEGDKIFLIDTLEDLLMEIETDSDNEKVALSLAKDSLQEVVSRYEWKRAAIKFLPTLTLVGFYGNNYFSPKFDLTNSKSWFTNSYVGLKLTLPLMGDLKSNEERKIAGIKHETDKMTTLQDRIDRSKNLAAYQTELNKAKSEMLLRKKNMELNEKRVSILKEQMNEGRIYPAKLQEGLKDLQKSHTDYLQAVYNVFVAKANLELSMAD